FLAEAASRGAACLVVHTLHDDVPANVPLVLVEDTTRALGMLAAYHRARFSIPVVAVTGSNGKTTTKELIAGVLGTRWPVLKPSGSFNNQWGLPLTLLRLTTEHQAIVLELGSQHPGEIASLAGLARPTVARGRAEARPVAGRCVWRDTGGVRILDDTYNANPVSVRSALETAAARRAAGPSGRLVVVLGDMLELGPIAEEAHQEMGRAVAA